MKPQLTWKKLGSTRCVGCEKNFVDTPDLAVVESEATDYTGGRPGYSANRPVQVMRRWHVDCLEKFEASNEECRRLAREDRERMANTLSAAAGLPLPFPDLAAADEEAALAEFERERAERYAAAIGLPE